MKRILYIILAVAVCSSTIKAQEPIDQKEIDSLQAALKNPIVDTMRALVLTRLARNYTGHDADKAIEYANQCLAVSEKIGFEKGVANAYYFMGNNEMAQSKFLIALDHYKKAAKIREKIGDMKPLARTYLNMGNIFTSFGNHPEALKHFFTALKIFERTGEKRNVANIYINVGTIYNKEKQYEDARKSYLTALKIYEELAVPFGVAKCYNNLANTSDAEGKHNEALAFHFKALKIQEEIKDTRNVAATLVDISNTYFYLGNYNESLKYSLKSLEMYESVESEDGVAIVKTVLGSTYLELKRYDDATKVLNEAIAIGKRINYLPEMYDAYQYLAKADSIKGNYKQALSNYQTYISLRDSVFNDENKEKVLQQKLQYDFDKKEAEYQYEQQLSVEKVKEQRALIIALLVGLVALLLGVALWITRLRRKQAQKESLAQQQFSQQLLETTEEERGRIARDLHDGVNQELLLLKRELFMQPETAIASEKVDNVIKEIRHISRNLHPVMLDSIGLRLAIETLCEQYMESTDVFITYEIEYNDSLPQNAELQVFRVVQEALTNTMKYANAKACRVEINDSNGSFSLKIQDNGTGFDVQKSLDSGKSFGLNSIIQRAKVIGATAKIQSSDKGTVIEIKK
jgi:signal transduction histidine kinase